MKKQVSAHGSIVSLRFYVIMHDCDNWSAMRGRGARRRSLTGVLIYTFKDSYGYEQTGNGIVYSGMGGWPGTE